MAESNRPLPPELAIFFDQHFGKDLTGISVESGTEDADYHLGHGHAAAAFGDKIFTRKPLGSIDRDVAGLMGHEVAHVFQHRDNRFRRLGRVGAMAQLLEDEARRHEQRIRAEYVSGPAEALSELRVSWNGLIGDAARQNRIAGRLRDAVNEILLKAHPGGVIHLDEVSIDSTANASWSDEQIMADVLRQVKQHVERATRAHVPDAPSSPPADALPQYDEGVSQNQQERYPMGIYVLVPRSSGGPSWAEVAMYLPNGKIRCTFQKDGQLAWRDVYPDVLDQLNHLRPMTRPAESIQSGLEEVGFVDAGPMAEDLESRGYTLKHLEKTSDGVLANLVRADRYLREGRVADAITLMDQQLQPQVGVNMHKSELAVLKSVLGRRNQTPHLRSVATAGAPVVVRTGSHRFPGEAREYEWPYTEPPIMWRVGPKQQPFQVSQLDPGMCYLWVVDVNGFVRIAPEKQANHGINKLKPQGRVVKHGDMVPHTDPCERGPARAGGELNYRGDKWVLDNNSSYSFGNMRVDDTPGSPESLDAVLGLLRRAGTDVSNIQLNDKLVEHRQFFELRKQFRNR